MEQNNNLKVKRSIKGTRMVIITAVILAALVLLNVGVSLIPRAYSNFVADSSDAYSISAKAKSFVKGLDTDVTIYYVYDSEMTYDADYAPKFRVMLDKYARLNDHVKVMYVDMNDQEFISQYSQAALIGSSLIIEGPERHTVLYFDMLFKYKFSDQIILGYEQMEAVSNAWYSVYQNYAQTYGEDAAIAYADQALAQYYGVPNYSEGCSYLWYADAMITSAIDYVTTEDIPTTYILAGHGEAELSENFTKMYFDDLSIRYFSINLDAAGSIPDNAATLVLNDPKTDITEQEKALLADFIAGGGSLILNTTPAAAKLPNLMALMGTYGLGASDALVLDDSLTYNAYLNKDQTTTEKETETETETETEAETEADAEAQAEEEATTEAVTEGETETGTETEAESTTEAETYPDDYLFVLPDSKHELVATADDIIHMAMLSEIYSMYMAAYQQYQQTGNALYQAYAQQYQQLYQSYSQTERNYQLLIAGAHPITVTETAGVSVKPIATTSDKGYLSTDPTAATYNMAVSATVKNGENTGSIVWFGFADSYKKEIAEELYKYNYGFLYGAVDYTGGTQSYTSSYTDIPAIDLGGTLDMHWGWMIAIAAVAIVILPLTAIITGIVICVKRKLK